MQSSVQEKRIEGKTSSRNREFSMIDFMSTEPEAGHRSKVARGTRTERRSKTVQKAKSKRRKEVSLWELMPEESQGKQEKSAQSLKRRQARKRRAYLYRALAFSMLLFCVTLICLLAGFVAKCLREEKEPEPLPIADIPVSNDVEVFGIEAPEIMTDFLEINDYSRPGTALEGIESIFVHYTANPGTSAAQNRSYFANLAETHERSASSHFIIGYEGEIIQCIPLDEQAYAVMTRNNDSISIECCYLDEDGKFTRETYDSLVHMLAWLMEEYNLEEEDILRHYDCGGKLCPLYYVDHESAWEQLLTDVKRYREDNRKIIDTES